MALSSDTWSGRKRVLIRIRAHSGRLQPPRHRGHDERKTGAGDEPPAGVLPAAGGYRDGTSRPRGRIVLLRMERVNPLLRRRGR